MNSFNHSEYNEPKTYTFRVRVNLDRTWTFERVIIEIKALLGSEFGKERTITVETVCYTDSRGSNIRIRIGPIRTQDTINELEERVKLALSDLTDEKVARADCIDIIP